MGYSEKINDPRFARYRKNETRWAWTFNAIISTAAIIGFYIYGERSYEMDNPEALYIGLAVAGMYTTITLFTTLGKKRGKDWEGVVTDKKVEKKRRQVNSGGDSQWQYYTTYSVIFDKDGGGQYKLSHEDTTLVYDYYQEGDRVRFHGRLGSLEKYDKSRDAIIFCNACASLNDINDTDCFRCGCPLLK